MSVSGALFDMIKLLDIVKTVISKMTVEEVYENSCKWAKEYDKELEEILQDKEYSLKVFGIERRNKKPRKGYDVKNSIVYMFNDKFLNVTVVYEYGKISNKEEINKIIQTQINDDKDTWFNKIKDLTEKCGYAREVKEFKTNPENWPGHVGDISTVLRVTLTGRQNTPDMYKIMHVLGKDSAVKRFEKAIVKNQQ